MQDNPQNLFVQAFHVLIDTKAFGSIIEGLIGYAVTALRQGDCQWAAQLYGLVKIKHNSTIYIQEKLNELETELLSQLTPVELDELSLQGADLDLTDVLNNIMEKHVS